MNHPIPINPQVPALPVLPGVTDAPDAAALADYWHGLIDEVDAGAFAKLDKRTLQTYRQQGGGPRYIQVSARCIRYRRIDLKAWADDRLRTSTAGDTAKAA